LAAAWGGLRELLFCVHHNRQHASALTKIGGRSIIADDEFAVT
jgi:hypothetical protein